MPCWLPKNYYHINDNRTISCFNVFVTAATKSMLWYNITQILHNCLNIGLKLFVFNSLAIICRHAVFAAGITICHESFLIFVVHKFQQHRPPIILAAVKCPPLATSQKLPFFFWPQSVYNYFLLCCFGCDVFWIFIYGQTNVIVFTNNFATIVIGHREMVLHTPQLNKS